MMEQKFETEYGPIQIIDLSEGATALSKQLTAGVARYIVSERGFRPEESRQ